MSLLAKAKPFQAPAEKAKKKSDKAEHEIANLEKLAVIDALIKQLTAVKQSFDAEVKDQARDIFLDSNGNKRPENFRGLDGIAEASCELRKRSATSVLTDEEVEQLIELDIPFETITQVEEAYVINPAYLDDQALLARIEKVPGLPDDFLLKQVGVTKRIVSDDTVDRAWADGKADELFDVIHVQATKPKLTTVDNDKTLAVVRTILGIPEPKKATKK